MVVDLRDTDNMTIKVLIGVLLDHELAWPDAIAAFGHDFV